MCIVTKLLSGSDTQTAKVTKFMCFFDVYLPSKLERCNANISYRFFFWCKWLYYKSFPFFLSLLKRITAKVFMCGYPIFGESYSEIWSFRLAIVFTGLLFFYCCAGFGSSEKRGRLRGKITFYNSSVSFLCSTFYFICLGQPTIIVCRYMKKWTFKENILMQIY